MSVFALKLLLTPLLLAAATHAARRWGPLVAGWIVGMPLTSGPVSLFLALEQGPQFAAASAVGALLATIAVITYCLAYSHAARFFSWPVSLLLALGAFFAMLGLLSRVTLPLLPSALLLAASVVCALFLEGKVDADTPPIPAPWWDIPFRMFAATAIVLLITALSSHLGPHMSGMLSALPVFITVMSTFSHKLCGGGSARIFLHGILMGSFAYAAFFIVASLAVTRLHIVAAYLLAVFCAGSVNLAFLGLQKTYGKIRR